MTPESLARNNSEAGHQAALFCWCAHPENREAFPGVEKLFAINNNAGKGDAVRGAMARAQGVKATVPDTFLPLARKGVHGLFIEMKRPEVREEGGGKITQRAGTVSDGQREKALELQADGYGYVACYTWAEAVEILKLYLTP